MNGPIVVLSLPVNPGNTAEDLNTTSETVSNVRSTEPLQLTHKSHDAVRLCLIFVCLLLLISSYKLSYLYFSNC
jgi:hypothetical protein